MKNIVSSFLAISLLTSCSHYKTSTEFPTRSTASRQEHGRPGYNGHYDGPPPDFNRDQWERRPTMMAYCDRFRNDSARHVLACSAGVEEAISMAQRFAGGHGREDGYLRGYSWGLNQAVTFNKNNSDEIPRGESSVDTLNSYLTNAESEGQKFGNQEGESLGTTEVKSRFNKALDTNVMPNSNFQIPPTFFTPTTDAYARYVGTIPSPEDILKQERFGRISFYDSYDHSYNERQWHEKNGRDLWSRDGIYDLHSKQWVDGEKSFQVWLEMPNHRKDRYNQLNDKVSINTNKGNRAPAQMTPSRGERPGNPNPPMTPIPPTTPVNPEVDFKVIFKDAFIQVYNLYALAEYSRNYHMSLDLGQRDGELTGTEIGLEIAFKKGLAQGFNRKFAQVSYSAYQNAFINSYSKGFLSTYDYYKNNPVLSLNFQNIIGLDEDGVVQPGEPLDIKFKVTNAGGVGTQLSYSVSGDIENAETFKDSIGAISSKTIVSPNSIGNVLSSLEDGATASYLLNVNGLREKLWQDIKRPIEITEIIPNFSAIDGSGMFNVTIANIGSIALNGAINFELRINGNIAKNVIANPMQAGEIKSYAIEFSNLDPLIWINGGYNTELLLKYNNVNFARKTSSLAVSNSSDSIAQYFSRLANEKGIIPAGNTIDTRLAEVRNIILQKNSIEVGVNVDGSGNIYRTNPEDTIPGKILKAKNSYSNNSVRAVSEFTSIADAMSQEAKRFKSIIFIHPKRDSYNEILKSISGKKYK